MPFNTDRKIYNKALV